MPEGDICTPGVLGFGRRVVLWYHRRVVLGGPDTVQLRTKERPTSVRVAGEMNLTMGRSAERAGGKVREEGREEERERGREKGKEGKGVVDRGRVRKGGREEEEGWEDAIKPYKIRLCSHQSVSASYNTTVFAAKNIL